MVKVYQEKADSGEMYLRLMQGEGQARLIIVTRDGELAPSGPLLQLDKEGVHLPGLIDFGCAVRAGLTNALDANGRLNVIGQEVEAERVQGTTYPAASHYGTGDMTIYPRPDGCVSFKTRTKMGGRATVATIPIASLRDLGDRINRHLAYLEQEGLA